MTTHPCILAQRIPWTEKPSGLRPTGSQRVGSDLAQHSAYSQPCLLAIQASQLRWTYIQTEHTNTLSERNSLVGRGLTVHGKCQ